MAVTDVKYSVYAVELSGGVPTRIGGIASSSNPLNIATRGETPSGSVYPQSYVATERKPVFNFSTFNCEDGLAQIGIIGLDIATLTTGLNIFGQKHATTGRAVAAGNHMQIHLDAGYVAPRQLSAAQGQLATFQVDVLPVFDTAKAGIIIVTQAATVPTTGITDDEFFTLGSIFTVGGIAVPQSRSVEITFGITFDQQSSDGKIDPEAGFVATIKPRIVVRGIDPEYIPGSIGIDGIACTHANSKLFLRKFQSPGVPYADASAEHLKFTWEGFATIQNLLDASGNDAGEVAVVIDCTYDGTNTPLKVTADQAIA